MSSQVQLAAREASFYQRLEQTVRNPPFRKDRKFYLETMAEALQAPMDNRRKRKYVEMVRDEMKAPSLVPETNVHKVSALIQEAQARGMIFEDLSYFVGLSLSNKDPETAMVLVEASPSETAKRGLIHYHIRNSSVEEVISMIDALQPGFGTLNRVFDEAACSGRTELVKRLVEEYRLTTRLDLGLALAAAGGHEEIASFLGEKIEEANDRYSPMSVDEGIEDLRMSPSEVIELFDLLTADGFN